MRTPQVRSRNFVGLSVSWSAPLVFSTFGKPTAPVGLEQAPLWGADPDRSIALQWEEPEDDGGLPVQQYEVQLARSGFEAMFTITVPFFTHNITRGGLPSGSTFLAAVRAQNELGWGTWSTPALQVNTTGLAGGGGKDGAQLNTAPSGLSAGAIGGIVSGTLIFSVGAAFAGWFAFTHWRGIKKKVVKRREKQMPGMRELTEEEIEAELAGAGDTGQSIVLNPTFALAEEAQQQLNAATGPKKGIARLGLGMEESTEDQMNAMAARLVRSQSNLTGEGL